jgi:anion-transporting  ArsA/GET3 family ATPase
LSHDLARLLATHKVIVCVGSGGVGKTTVSAALGVAAACTQRRTLVLTIDPARRLANALGLQAFREEIQTLDVATLQAAGIDAKAPLDVAMLDVKRTFDRVIERFVADPARREKVLRDPFYQQASTALAGTQEYMAMQRLYECVLDGSYDLVVLDTPPSAHALDFLDAPRRMVDLFDSRAFRLLLGGQGSERGGLFSRGSLMMRGLGRFTGAEMFERLLGFFGLLSATFDGFVERAGEVSALLRSGATAFVLVSACDAASTEEGLFLTRALRRDEMQVAAWVLNRVAPYPTSPLSAGEALADVLRAQLRTAAPSPPAGTAEALAAAAHALASLAAHDAGFVEQLNRRLSGTVPVVSLPRSDDEPSTLEALKTLAELLLAGGATTAPPAGRPAP